MATSLLDKLKKVGSVVSSTMAESSFFNNTEVISTEIPALNVALSGKLDGGITPGVLMVSGPSKSFKTAISLYMVAAYLKKYKDAVCIFYDTEYGSTPEYFETYGIDLNRVLHIPIEHIEQLKFDIVKKLEEIGKGDKVIFLIDSIGNAASKKELDDAIDEKAVADMSRAKALKSFWRIVTPQITGKQLPMIAINHVYMEIGLYPKAIVGGGCLLPGTKIQTPNGLKSVEDFVVGDVVVTKLGNKEVTAVWNPDTLINGTPDCYEIEFEDGTIVKCSAEHKFLINDEWITASNIVVGMDAEVVAS